MSTGPKKGPKQDALLEVSATGKPAQEKELTSGSGRFVCPRPFRS